MIHLYIFLSLTRKFNQILTFRFYNSSFSEDIEDGLNTYKVFINEFIFTYFLAVAVFKLLFRLTTLNIHFLLFNNGVPSLKENLLDSGN